MSIVKISWSGGKDSTASCLLHLLSGDQCKIVCYVPMLNSDIPLILRSHYDFILSTADFFRSLGADVFIVHGISYFDHVHSIITRGKNKGEFRGSGLGFGFCLFRNYSKITALRNCDVGYYDYEDIGIAFDETDRLSQLTIDLRSILFDLGFTERDSFDLCYKYGLISPHYYSFHRDGCAICPNASSSEFHAWLHDYPDAVSVLSDIEQFCKFVRSDITPYRGFRWWSDLISNGFYQYPLWG